MPASKRKVDFKGVKDRPKFKRKHLPEGDYLARIVDVNDHESSDNEGWVFNIKLEKHGASYPYYCMIADNQLWKIRNLLAAAGLRVPKKLVNVDPNKAVGKQIAVTLEDDEYEGRLRSSIEDVFPASDLAPDDEEDDADEDLDDDEEEVEEEVEEDEDEDDDEDEEEEEPAPKKKSKSKSKSKAKPTKKKASDDDDDEDVDDEELEELEIEEI